MLRVFLAVSISLFLACSSDSPRPTSPAPKAVATADAPPKPTNLRVEVLTDTSARVSWDAVEEATDYDLNYRPVVGGRWTNEPHRGTRLWNVIDDLEPNTEYRWAVRAENGDGASQWVFAENFTTFESLTASRFDIELRFDENVPESHRPIFRQAADRWEEIIIGDLPDVHLPDWYDLDELLELGEPVDDIVIVVRYNDSIGAPGIGGVLWFRDDSDLPGAGQVTIDGEGLLSFWREVGELREVEDIEDFVSVKFRVGVSKTALHEIGHALGITSAFWNHDLFYPSQKPTENYFAGEQAIAAFRASPGIYYEGNVVPLYGGGHWYGHVFGGQAIMDNVKISGALERISTVTVGALADIGYEVDFSQGHVCTLFDPDDNMLSDEWSLMHDMAKLAMYQQNPDLCRVDGEYYKSFIRSMIWKGHLEEGYDGISQHVDWGAVGKIIPNPERTIIPHSH